MPRDVVSHAERVLHLSNSGAFSQLDRDDLSAMAHHTRERLFRRREVLFDEDNPPSSLWVVVDGRVQVERDGHHVVSVETGYGVGALAILSTRALDNTRAWAQTDTLTLELDHSAMMELVEDRFSIAAGIMRVLSSGLAQMLDQLPGERTFPSQPESEWTCRCSTRPVDFVERLFFLRHGYVFAGSSLESVAEIARGLIERRYPAGTVIWREGDRADAMLMVVDGEIELRPADRRWRERVLPFGVTGSLATMAALPRRGTATATRDVLALEAPRDLLLDVMEDNHEMVMRLLTGLTDQYVDLQDTIARAEAAAQGTREPQEEVQAA